MPYISRGTPIFRGTCREIPYIKSQYHFIVVPTNGWDDEGTDCAPFQEDFFNDMSDGDRPQDSLDRPYMRDVFGVYPGTITLAAYAASFGCPMDGGPPLDGGQVKVRRLNMTYVVSRLRKLKHEGIEDRDPTLLYHELYANLLYDGIMHADDPHRFEMGRQRWLENVEIESPASTHPAAQSTVTFHFQNKNNQVDILRNFGWTLK
ncbi:hypothetical protein AA313_de0209027 [Arthrobotrys entomopaga]|nr:hypothetical protein AA313_de0209027 [Arthrobotrys entomopaga]